MTSAGLVFLGVLALLELLLILLVARKVRVLDERLSLARRALPAEGGGRPWLAAGTQIPPFWAETVRREPVSLDWLRGRESVIGFFSPGCRPCGEQLPAFARLADDRGRQPLAVIVGPAAGADEYLAVLDGAVPVVREEQGGPVTTAFAARAFPGVFLLDKEGRVLASGASVGLVTGAFEGVATATARS